MLPCGFEQTDRRNFGSLTDTLFQRTMRGTCRITEKTPTAARPEFLVFEKGRGSAC